MLRRPRSPGPLTPPRRRRGAAGGGGLRPHRAQAVPAPRCLSSPFRSRRRRRPSSGDPKFDAFLAQARTEALDAGITAATFDSATAGIAPIPAIIAMNANQPEFTKPVWSYLDAAVSARRIKDAQFMLARYGEVLDRIAAQ